MLYLSQVVRSFKKFFKITTFPVFTGALKNTRNYDLIFEFYDSNYPIIESF